MLSKYLFLFAFLFAGFFASAQITTDPVLPVASKKVVLTFDSSKDSRLGFYTGDLYAHTGVIIAGNTNWQHVIESWGNNTIQPKLTNKGNGIYELEISPDIKTFYGVLPEEKVLNLAFVFRSSDSKQQTNDLLIPVYEEGLVIKLSTSGSSSIPAKNQTLTLSATSSVAGELKLSVNETTLAQNSGTQLSAEYTFTESGEYLFIAEVISGNETVRDTVQVFVREDVLTAPKPTSYRKGINYTGDTAAALVLWAPLKEYVFVVGDFNDWKPASEFQMKKDGDYFWLDIPNLEKGKEYLFQYLIDGEIKIADPYTEKIADPWNDKYIGNSVYPNLIQYPENKTEGIASVLQAGQEEFNWEITDFQLPEKEKLVIYELLVRDFTAEHSYKAVREKLGYLEDLRINVLELMPINEFEGNNSWGYNPSFYFAPDKYYGPKNELKKLIDECHKRGIAVVIDMVLNHSYGQSPFVQMYMDSWTITAENPWYNRESNFQNTSLRWGYDFNHESQATRELVDSVASFWMNEYKVDGFRFDFTKGFSNTPYGSGSWGSEYDASRIANLERMTSEIRKRKPDAIVIFEHLANNSEETELANYGILLWGNMHANYLEAAKGNTANSDLSWGLYNERGWNAANLVAYPESHDEERIMYDIKINGGSSGSYNIKNQQTALKRIGLNAVFYLPLPGPKMIWQFGERGYDLSINRCSDGSVSNDCRLSPKPPYWQYLDNPDRTGLFQVMAKLNDLKQRYEEFSPESFTYNLQGGLKWYKLNRNNNHVIAVGNFGVLPGVASVTFQDTGKWYEFFTRDSIEINSVQQNISLAPGEYRLYSTRYFDNPKVITETDEVPFDKGKLTVYPNPATNVVTVTSANPVSQILIYSLTGKLMFQNNVVSEKKISINVAGFTPGVYLLKGIQENNTATQKFIKR